MFDPLTSDLCAEINAAPAAHDAVLRWADQCEDHGLQEAVGLRRLVDKSSRGPWLWYMTSVPFYSNDHDVLRFPASNEGRDMVLKVAWNAWHHTPSSAYLAAAREIIKPEYASLHPVGESK